MQPHEEPRLDPPTDAEWYAARDPNCCEAPCCTARGKRHGSDLDPAAEKHAALRDRLTLCKFHYDAIATGVVACWGEPPLGVVWRLGEGGMATWYRNEMRLQREEVKAFMKSLRERERPGTY